MSARVNPARSPWASLIPLCLAVALHKVDATIVNVALPTIQRDRDATPETLVWTVNAYSLALAAIIPLAGTLGDRFGRRRVFIMGIVMFAVASAGCGLSPDDSVLIGFRALQGLSAEVLVPLSMSIVGATFRDEDLPTAYGLWSGVSSIGFVIGPLLGGVLVQHVGWSVIFWINVPLSLLLVPMVLLLVRETRDPVARPFDLPGILLATTRMFLTAWALIGTTGTPWLAPGALVPLAAAIAAFIVFVWWETRTPHPVLPLDFFRQPGFALGASVGAIVYAFPAITLFLALYFQGVLGYGLQDAGLLLIPLAAALRIVAVIAGRITRRIGALASMTTGLVLMAAGTGILATLGVGTDLVRIAIAEVVLDVGIMFTIPAASGVMMGAVPRERAGVASAVMQTFRQGGAVLFVAVLSAVLAARAANTFAGDVPSGAARFDPDLIGANIEAVRSAAGTAIADAAAESWVSGMQVAMAVIAIIAMLGALMCGLVARRRYAAAHGHPATHAG